MTNYLSTETTVQSGTTTILHTPEADTTLANIMVRWQGISIPYLALVNEGNVQIAFRSYTLDDPCITSLDDVRSCPGTFSTGYFFFLFEHVESSAKDITIQKLDSASNVLDTATIYDLPPYNTSYGATMTIFATDIGADRKWKFDIEGTATRGHYGYVYTNYTYQTVATHYTSTPTALCNGTSVTMSGTLAGGTWCSWLSAPATFFDSEGEQSITFQISDSLTATFQFTYDYFTPEPVIGWTSYGEPDDYTSYETHNTGYSTTFMSGTWPTSSLTYGDGDIVLEFSTNLGVTSPATTWTINTDLFMADFEYAPERISTVIQGRGTKLEGGTIYSIHSDWATYLTLSASVDTFLLQDAAVGATMIYVFTDLGSGTVDISPNTSRQEQRTVSASGLNATGRWLGLSATLSYAHYKFEEVIGTDNTTFYLTGSAADVTSWYSTMTTQWGAISGANLWPVKIGTEIIYMWSLTASTSTSLTLAATTGAIARGQYGIAYPHHIGAPAFCVPTIGVYTEATSMFDEYGVSEISINPIGIVDGHTLDMYCWNALMNSTTMATSGRAMIPADLMPSSIGIGDWVTVAENAPSGFAYTKSITINNAGSATTNYQMMFNIYRSSNTSTGTAIYVGTDCEEDYADIRFYTSGGTLLDHWTEDYTSSVATVWVEFDNLPVGNTSFTLYYKNSSATDTSNATNTFRQYHGAVTGNADDTSNFTDTAAVRAPFIFEAKVKHTGADSPEGYWGVHNGSAFTSGATSYAYIDSRTGLNKRYLYCKDGASEGSVNEAPEFSVDTYYRLKIVLTSDNIVGYVDDNRIGSMDMGFTLNDDVGLSMYTLAATAYQAWSFVRNYVSTEPTVATYGIAQSASTSTNYRIVGMEFDQKTNSYIIEFGAVEDYYLAQESKYRGSYDSTLSLM